MELLACFVLALFVLAWFSDLVLMALLRLVAFTLALGLAAAWQSTLAVRLGELEIPGGTRAAVGAGWLGWTAAAAIAVRIIVHRARRGSVSDAAVVAMETACAALCFTLPATAVWAAPTWMSGVPLRLSPVLAVLAVIGAALDLLMPRLLTGVARRLS